MNLIDSNDILKASKLDRFGGNLGGSLVAKLVMYIMRLNKINKLYSDVYSDNPEAFLDRLIEALGVTIEVNEEDLQKIPKEGAFITISNHPFGGLDGIILIKLLSKLSAEEDRTHQRLFFRRESFRGTERYFECRGIERSFKALIGRRGVGAVSCRRGICLPGRLEFD